MRLELAVSAALLAASAGLGLALDRQGAGLELPAPETPSSLSSLAARGFGVRKVMADKKWFDLLQYSADYGYIADGCSRAYTLTREGTDLDPHFLELYSYGSGMLMWQCEKPRLAARVLDRGIARNPSYVRFKLYRAAFAYHVGGRVSEEIEVLERLAFTAGAPFMVRRMLANLHVKLGNRRKAAAVCMLVLETSADEGERRWAASLLDRFSR